MQSQGESSHFLLLPGMEGWFQENDIHNSWGAGGAQLKGRGSFSTITCGLASTTKWRTKGKEEDESTSLWFFPTLSSAVFGWLFTLLFLFGPQRK